jgi:ATP-dependent Clp protease ATP-binding subunit ClpC
MNSYNFTARIRNVLSLAREQAAQRNHDFVGTEHILLAIVVEGEGVAATVIQALGADLRQIKLEIENIIPVGSSGTPSGPDVPYTSGAKRVLELAMAETVTLHHSYVGTDHLLLGLIREGQGVGAQVLAKAGITYEKARDELLRLLGTA